MFGSGLLHDGPVVHPLSAVKTQPASLCCPTMEGMTEVLKKTPTVENLASGLDVHSSPEVHAAGSTVPSASASGVQRCRMGMWSLLKQ